MKNLTEWKISEKKIRRNKEGVFEDQMRIFNYLWGQQSYYGHNGNVKKSLHDLPFYLKLHTSLADIQSKSLFKN